MRAIMKFRKRRLIHPAWGRAVLVSLALASLSFLIGCSDTSEQAAQPGDSVSVAPSSSMVPPLGAAGLNQRVFEADIIARAKLISTNATAENVGTDANGATVYRGLMEFKFKVLEYLKGTGGNEVVVFVTGHRDNPYATMDLALEAAQSWERDRDTRWDNREALIFAETPAGSSGQDTRYSFGPYGYIEAYALDSRYKVWLPSASPGASGSAPSGDTRFLLEEPDGSASATGTGQPETISVSEMKAVIAKLEKWVNDGEGVEGYLECIKASFFKEAWINGKKERGESLNTTYDFYLDSGVPAGMVMNEPLPIDGKWWLEGKDKSLFAIENGTLHTTRPLPTSEYRFYLSYQGPELIPCDYFPDEYKTRHENIVHVTSPAGTLHEAFFDPVTVGSAIAADATNGVLMPTAFTDGNGASATLQRIAWEAGKVKLKLSPHTGLANHVVDFIALDGKVSLSLDADEATVDAANNTLSWPVSHQPWKDGDKLMLRIHDGRNAGGDAQDD